MSFFALPNLISRSVTPCEPWTFQGHIPDEVKGKKGKKERDAWINNPETLHQCYSAFEGIASNARISENKGGEEGNPPLKLHAFVADLDCPVSNEELAAGIERLRFVPNFFERTLSGNARLIWLFEKPVTFPNKQFAVEFLELALVRLKVEQIAPAFDRPAWLEPNRYYTNSCDWAVVDAGARIGEAMLQGWVLEVAEKHLWKKQKNAVAIPLPLILAEIEKKFPTHGWPGEFIEESQGPSFWLPGSTSPKSAIVKPTGFFTFSSSASKPFYSWADLFGADFVKNYETEKMGEVVKDIYHDGKTYYRRDGYGDWKAFTKEDVYSHLSVTRGLSSQKIGDQSSETSRAMEYIKDWQAITGAAPFVFQPSGVLVRNGNRFLNTHTRRPLAPVDNMADCLWGSSGRFPFLSTYFDGIFDPPEQLPYFLSWLARFYCGAWTQNLESGQNIFLLGKPGVGKTLLSQGILPLLMGGSADAEAYMLGRTDFNSDLFEVGLWTIDDNSATVDAVSHRKFSSMAKKMAANTTFSYHAKFRIPCSVDWLGRVFVTANDDEESARIVPDLSISNLDKLSLFRTTGKPPVEYPVRRELQQILRDELPYFARFLLSYDIPEHCRSSSRFGVAAYHEKSLMRTAEQSSRSAGFLEIIEDWSQSYFFENTGEYWEGTSYQLLKALNKHNLDTPLGIRGLSADVIGRSLATLSAKGMRRFGISPDSLKDVNAETRKWRIYKPHSAAIPELPIGDTYGRKS